MKLHDLSAVPGSTKVSKRVGRGHGSGQGKTAGRGTKGQNARTGKKLRVMFQGGQRPLAQAVPKARGFKSLRTPAQVVYMDHLNAFDGKTVDKTFTINKEASNVVLKTSYDTTADATFGTAKTYSGTVGYQNAWMLTPVVKVVDNQGTDKSADFDIGDSSLALITDNNAGAQTFTVKTKTSTEVGDYKIVVTLGDQKTEQAIKVNKKTVANTDMTINNPGTSAVTSITVTGFTTIGIPQAEIEGATFTLTGRVGGQENTVVTVTSASLSSDTLTFASTTFEAGTLSLTVADTANFDFSDTATTVTVA